MDKFNIIGELKDRASDNGWGFLTGDNFYMNYESSVSEYSNGQYILACDFNSKPTFNLNKISKIEYTGFIMLGLKFDNNGTDNTPDESFSDGTPASLDETFIQKFESRLYLLHTQLASFLGTFACENGLDLIGVEMVNMINDFDNNIDFVRCTLTVSDESFL